MNSTDALKIHHYLSTKGPGGTALLTIARETGIKSTKLKQYFSQLPRSFVRVGESPKYAVNTISSVKDHEAYIVAQLNRHIRRQKIIWVASPLVILVSIVVAAMRVSGL